MKSGTAGSAKNWESFFTYTKELIACFYIDRVINEFARHILEPDWSTG